MLKVTRRHVITLFFTSIIIVLSSSLFFSLSVTREHYTKLHVEQIRARSREKHVISNVEKQALDRVLNVKPIQKAKIQTEAYDEESFFATIQGRYSNELTYRGGSPFPILSVPYNLKHNGVIVLTASPIDAVLKYESIFVRRVELLRGALENIDHYYNKFYGPYPIVIFHEDYDEYTRNECTKKLKYSPHITWIKINFKQVRQDEIQIAEQIKENDKSWGYRQMCRFYSGPMQNHPALQAFEYYMRFDDDSRFTTSPNQDLFEQMREKNLDYMYRASLIDSWGFNELKNLVDEFSAKNGLPSVKISEMQPYNNFHVSRFGLWRDRVTDLFKYIDEARLFSKYKVGDALVHDVVLDLFVPTEKKQKVKEFGYRHNFHLFAPMKDYFHFEVDRWYRNK